MKNRPLQNARQDISAENKRQWTMIEDFCISKSIKNIYVSNILGEIVGVEEGLFLLLIQAIRDSPIGRAKVSDGRKIELTELSLS